MWCERVGGKRKHKPPTFYHGDTAVTGIFSLKSNYSITPLLMFLSCSLSGGVTVVRRGKLQLQQPGFDL